MSTTRLPAGSAPTETAPAGAIAGGRTARRRLVPLVAATLTWAAGLNFLLDHSTWQGLPHGVWYSGLTRRFPEGSSAGGLEGHVVAEFLELADRAALGPGRLDAGVVVGSEVVVERSGLGHVPDRDQDGVLDGHDGLGLASSGREASVAGPEVAVLVAGGVHRRGAQHRLEVGVPGPGMGVLGPAGGLVVSGTHPGPGGEVARGRKPGHVGTGLRGDHLRGGG